MVTWWPVIPHSSVAKHLATAVMKDISWRERLSPHAQHLAILFLNHQDVFVQVFQDTSIFVSEVLSAWNQLQCVTHQPCFHGWKQHIKFLHPVKTPTVFLTPNIQSGAPRSYWRRNKFLLLEANILESVQNFEVSSYLSDICPVPMNVPHAEVSIVGLPPYDEGHTATYICEPCYKGTGKVTCLQNGNWSSPPICTGFGQLFLKRNLKTKLSNIQEIFIAW